MGTGSPGLQTVSAAAAYASVGRPSNVCLLVSSHDLDSPSNLLWPLDEVFGCGMGSTSCKLLFDMLPQEFLQRVCNLQSHNFFMLDSKSRFLLKTTLPPMQI